MRGEHINLGFLCNSYCLFCRQAELKKGMIKNKTTCEIKQEMKRTANSFQEVILTGGEPTIRADFFEIIRFAKKLGFKRIQIQSNGRIFSDGGFCKKTVEAGANGFYFSLHGHNSEVHDFLTRTKGSFQQTISGIRNITKLGHKIETNTVITKQNCQYLEKIQKLLISLQVVQQKYSFIHPFADGRCLDCFDRIVPYYSESSKYIERILELGSNQEVDVIIADVPLCLMPKKIKNLELTGKLGDYFNLEVASSKKNVKFKKKCSKKHMKKSSLKVKGQNCHLCKFDHMCEGIWRVYAEKRGFSELAPVKS